jgi:hypothetical protein
MSTKAATMRSVELTRKYSDSLEQIWLPLDDTNVRFIFYDMNITLFNRLIVSICVTRFVLQAEQVASIELELCQQKRQNILYTIT